MGQRTRLVAAMAAVVIALGTVAGCSSKPKTPDAGDAVGAFLAGWRAHGFGSSVTFIDTNGATVAPSVVAAQITKLSGDLASKTPTFNPAKPKVNGTSATESVSVHWPVTAGVTWTYQTTVSTKLVSDQTSKTKAWRVIWSPAVINPRLKATDTLRVNTLQPDRGEILDTTGAAIVSAHDVVTVGVEPSRVKDITSLVAALNAAFKSVNVTLDLSGLPAQVAAAKPDAFVTVVTLRKEVYEQIRAQIHDLPGTVFQDGTQQLAPTATFARALLGTVGPVTKERMDANPGKYAITDQVGFGGIQQQYDDMLRGTAGVDVVIPGQGLAADGTPYPDTVMYKVDPVAGKPVQTTIDVKVQNAADKALAHETKPAAIIAMSISTGHILAVANGPGAAGYDLALQAQVPPGSTFKTITATNVLDAGKVTPSTIVNCPKQLVVNGRVFMNDGGEAFGKVPLLQDYARSCNTAFASLAPKLGTNGLQKTAAQLGIGGKWSVGVDTFTGSVAADGTPVDQAAAAFGQGKTLVSPVALVSAVGAVARGHWIAPTVIMNPAVTGNAAAGTPLKPTTVAAMKTMMRAVVTSGTGKACNGIAGGPVYGKTGTAEYNSDPHDSHSWFMGYQGDLAFAVFVENGGKSTAAAVPIAKNFLVSLH
ncbi:MAG TPA: penicillin-binding transpeptidase domain-containing protein [Micromonosporaceae bacterium]|jgi:cell division protein FtsI/penicillin-binding protein 2|nr:penicillin-binding transpeptidase domain-containing protein [Micromonosporaceae bacterium]